MTVPPPDVAVTMPTRNGGDVFARTLVALAAQKTEKSVEWIAFDSGSTDGTLERLNEHAVHVVEISPDDFDWGRVRDAMIAEARAPIVIQLSQDAVPADTDWLDSLIAPLQGETVAVSCGSSIPDPDRDFPQFQWEKNGYFYFTRELAKYRKRYGRGLSFANAAIRRSVWEELRIDPQATGEDFQFQMKLDAAGHQIAFPDDAPVFHHHNYATRALWRRCRNEGLALRGMGFPYNELDLFRDLIGPRQYAQWVREAARGTLRSQAEWLFPWLRPLAVYTGSRFAGDYIWY